MRDLIRYVATLLLMLCMSHTTVAQDAQVDRRELPVKGPWYPAITTMDAAIPRNPSSDPMRAAGPPPSGRLDGDRRGESAFLSRLPSMQRRG